MPAYKWRCENCGELLQWRSDLIDHMDFYCEKSEGGVLV